MFDQMKIINCLKIKQLHKGRGVTSKGNKINSDLFQAVS